MYDNFFKKQPITHYIIIQDLTPFSFVCFAIFSFDFCSCLFIFCFRPLSLSFLPLSPIAYLLFLLALIFSPRGCRCVVSSVFAHFHCPATAGTNVWAPCPL